MGKEKSKKRKHSSSSEDSSSSKSSDSEREKKKLRKLKKKLKKEQKKAAKVLKKKLKEEKKKLKKERRSKSSSSTREEPSKIEKDPPLPAASDIPIELMERSKAMAPMTKEEWEKRQSVVRRVYDEESGRHRLIKGDGEVLEEIVSRDRHKAINRSATQADGAFFQSQTVAKHL